MDKIYLISRLHNALWNCYFLSKLLFQDLYFWKVLTYTLSQELLFDLWGSQSDTLLRNLSIK